MNFELKDIANHLDTINDNLGYLHDISDALEGLQSEIEDVSHSIDYLAESLKEVLEKK